MKTKECPFCGSEIQFDAIKCRYCREMLDINKIPTEEQRVIKLPVIHMPPIYKYMNLISIFFLLSIIVASFLLYYFYLDKFIIPSIGLGIGVIFILTVTVLYYFVKHYHINSLYYSGLAIVFSIYSIALFLPIILENKIDQYWGSNKNDLYETLSFAELILFIVAMIILILITVQLIQSKSNNNTLKLKNLAYAFVVVLLCFILYLVDGYSSTSIFRGGEAISLIYLTVATAVLYFSTRITVKDTIGQNKKYIIDEPSQTSS